MPDPNIGVAVCHTYPGGGLERVRRHQRGSTGHRRGLRTGRNTRWLGSPNSYPYAATSGLNDVTEGSNGACSVPQLRNAGAGWDGPTGLGTPSGTGAFTSAA
jgi:hypothetical protein